MTPQRRVTPQRRMIPQRRITSAQYMTYTGRQLAHADHGVRWSPPLSEVTPQLNQAPGSRLITAVGDDKHLSSHPPASWWLILATIEVTSPI